LRFFFGPHPFKSLHDFPSGLDVSTCVHVILLLPECLLDFGLLSFDLLNIENFKHLVVNVLKLKLKAQLHLLFIVNRLLLLESHVPPCSACFAGLTGRLARALSEGFAFQGIGATKFLKNAVRFVCLVGTLRVEREFLISDFPSAV
jgi:hypothetical protein